MTRKGNITALIEIDGRRMTDRHWANGTDFSSVLSCTENRISRMSSIISNKPASYSDTFETSSSISSSESLEELWTRKEESAQSGNSESDSESRAFHSTGTSSERTLRSVHDSDTCTYRDSSQRIPSSYSSTRTESYNGTYSYSSTASTCEEKTRISAAEPNDSCGSYTEHENTDDDGDSSSFSDTQSYRSELSFVDDSQDTTSDQYSYSETFEPSTVDTPATHSAATGSMRVRMLETLREESDYEDSQSLQKEDIYSFDRSVETRSSYDDTFEPSDSYTDSFRIRTKDIREISEAELTAAEAQEEREEFINRMCEQLKKKKPDVHRIPQKKYVREDPVLVSYCRKKINQLNSGTTDKKDILSEFEKGTRKKKKPARPIPLETYGLNPAILERLKLANIMEHMKKLSQMEIHDVLKCKKCRKQQQIIDEAKHRRRFLEHYSRRLQSENMDEKVQQHLIKMNSVNLIGQIVAERPHRDLNSYDLLEEYERQILRRKQQGGQT
ncbi:clumping factor A-like [Gigantopelta aegis]|uniref:clumping factor A-like n=1 Tax=Gigantopelta aegis TaxID=1735272 RepID=UPI001B88B336|nr:clumping factor A-like [Gigantopelta aegis]